MSLPDVVSGLLLSDRSEVRILSWVPKYADNQMITGVFLKIYSFFIGAKQGAEMLLVYQCWHVYSNNCSNFSAAVLSELFRK